LFCQEFQEFFALLDGFSLADENADFKRKDRRYIRKYLCVLNQFRDI